MSAVIEVRTYRATPGDRDTLIAALRHRSSPGFRDLGIKVLGPFPSAEDDDTFVWLRGFPDADRRQPMNDAFYDSPLWLDELEPVLMPLIEHYEAVVVDDTVGLWETWPDTG